MHEDQADRAPVAGDPLYYRIQSAGFLIEFDDTPEDSSHVHVVIRSIDGDFAREGWGAAAAAGRETCL